MENINMKRTKISIHAAREGGDVIALCQNKFYGISIHAAREGGDAVEYIVVGWVGISIHAAREGGDVLPAAGTHRHGHFNPRRP